jgi:hypothetical protein
VTRISEPPPGSDTTPIPLIDLPPNTYLGFEGGLYPGGSNVMPAVHAATGIQRGNAVVRLNASGVASGTGKYVLLSIGMSNASDEFCRRNATTGCSPGSLMAAAAADNQVDHSGLVVVNGAIGGATESAWDSPTDPAYDTVRLNRLPLFNVTEKQVEVVWLKGANANPAISLPSSNADAYALERLLGNTLRALKTRYPNIKQVFVSSRTYGGYATTSLNPEPFAYESGFSVKWLIAAQIAQMAGSQSDPIAGDLNYNTVAPWSAWGPYLWAKGATPRSDGLSWLPADFRSDGTHPSESSGVPKVGSLLLAFFKTSPQTRCWFLASGVCS